MRASREKFRELALHVRDDRGFCQAIYTRGVTTDEDVRAAIARVRQNLGNGVSFVESARDVALVHEMVCDL